MPYIAKEDRDRIDKQVFSKGYIPKNGGEIQYIIARLVQLHYTSNCNCKPRYADMEAIMGSLQGASLEHYRCVVAPYEDKKIEENGLVYRIESSESY